MHLRIGPHDAGNLRRRATHRLGDGEAARGHPRATSEGRLLLELQRAAGNAAVARLIPALSRQAVAPPAAPYATLAEVKSDMVSGGGRDFSRLWPFANGRSMADLLALWQAMNGAVGLLEASKSALPAASGVNIPRLQVAMEAVLRRGHGSRIVFELDNAATLSLLEPGAAKRVLAAVGTEVRTVPRIRAAPGFTALSADEQRRVLIFVAGSTTLSAGGANAFDAVLASKVKRANPAAFRAVLASKGGTAELGRVSEVPAESVAVRLAVPVAVNQHPYHSGPADAMRTTVTFDDPLPTTIGPPAPVFNASRTDIMDPVRRPKPSVGSLPSVPDVVSLLRRLPRPARATLVRVDLEPRRNPDDATWATTPGYAKADFRSDMTAGADGTVNIYPLRGGRTMRDMVSALAHESGHAIAYRRWGDPGGTGTGAPTNPAWTPWYDAVTADSFRASKYAKASLGEDFSEAWLLFTTTLGTPREPEVRALMPRRYAIMSDIVASEHSG